MTNANGQLVWNTFPRPYGDIAEKTMTDPLSGRVVVTNLRLPGQYDERLLGSLGLQGPYYNWNRWYLPGVGRYLEVDPLSLRIPGDAARTSLLELYAYARANPLRRIDPQGLYTCTYSISLHRMTCLPDTPGHPVFDSDRYVSGQNVAGVLLCRDNPNCTAIPFIGPLPPSAYGVGGRTTSGGHRRNLTPLPGSDMKGRDSMQTHGCSNPDNCSEGCIAATDNGVRDLFDNLLDLEPDNTVTVIP